MQELRGLEVFGWDGGPAEGRVEELGSFGGTSSQGTWWCREQESVLWEHAGACAGPLSAHRVAPGDHSWACARVPAPAAARGWHLQFAVWFLDLWGLFMASSDPDCCWERSTPG